MSIHETDSTYGLLHATLDISRCQMRCVQILTKVSYKNIRSDILCKLRIHSLPWQSTMLRCYHHRDILFMDERAIGRFFKKNTLPKKMCTLIQIAIIPSYAVHEISIQHIIVNPIYNIESNTLLNFLTNTLWERWL